MKVKNLYWDEITSETYDETTPLWFREEDAVSAVPSEQDIQQAHLAKLDTWLAYVCAEWGDREDRWAEYMAAIDHHSHLEFQRTEANLKEAGICSI